MLVVPEATAEGVLTYLTGANPGQYETITMRLYQNDVTPTTATVLADLTEADFSGYAEIAGLDYGGGYVNAEGLPEMAIPSQQFDHNGGVDSNLIYGYYLVTADVTPGLLGIERFPTPVSMATAADVCIVLSKLNAFLSGLAQVTPS